MNDTCEIDGCPGTLTLTANRRGDRSRRSPISRMKYQCSADSIHEFEDPRTMPRDRSRSITE